MENKYFVHKIRYGTDEKWREPWKYFVVKDEKEILGHETLESLAKKLSDFQGIDTAVLFPGDFYGNGPRVSLTKRSLAQYGTVSDNELARLAVLIHKNLN